VGVTEYRATDFQALVVTLFLVHNNPLNQLTKTSQPGH
jgi:hypothetical protein